ncbi:MAG TPA: PP0621 family protein [Ramlibacter sp.]|uniref:PP0621 family protein n=1 Tax=Ramlibacter sp. TaxID=1917967 RepID=UPI002CB99FCC|nr:PP0621 family protein [Ramlibacter sp.]HVZ45556.1 PP0621 family protein [Ramlibacter sp.]
MKFLLLFAVLWIAYLFWRGGRIADASSPRRDTPKDAQPQEMVRCAVCSVHLPRADALEGEADVFYCSPDHRRLGGG